VAPFFVALSRFLSLSLPLSLYQAFPFSRFSLLCFALHLAFRFVLCFDPTSGHLAIAPLVSLHGGTCIAVSPFSHLSVIVALLTAQLGLLLLLPLLLSVPPVLARIFIFLFFSGGACSAFGLVLE